jgi:hypothetical protein
MPRRPGQWVKVVTAGGRIFEGTVEKVSGLQLVLIDANDNAKVIDREDIASWEVYD